MSATTNMDCLGRSLHPISLTVTCTTADEIRFPEIEITANLTLTAVSGEPSFGTGGDTVQRPGR